MSTLLAPHADATQRDHPMRVRATRPVTSLDRLLAEEQLAVAAIDDVRATIGRELAAQRKARRLTVAEASFLSGVRPTWINQLEHYRTYSGTRWRGDAADRLAVTYANTAEHPLGPENSTTAD